MFKRISLLIKRPNESLFFLSVLCFVALIMRIYLSKYNTYYNDVLTFQSWSLELIRHGFNTFYSLGISDYPPGYLYILWITGKLFYFLAFKLNYVNLELIFKLPAIFADIGVGALMFFIAKRFISLKAAIFTAAIFLFNPFSFINSTFWGQVEAVMMFFLLLSVYFLISKKLIFSAIALGIAQTIKPIALIALPLILLYLFYVLTKRSWRRALIYIAVFLATIILIFVPFNNTNNIFGFVLDRYTFNFGFYKALSLNAFNIWGAFSMIENGRIIRVDNSLKEFFISYQNLGYLIFGSIYLMIAGIIYRLRSSKKEIIDSILIQSLSIIYLTLFIFFTRLHERHVYYGVVFSLVNLFVVGKISRLMIIGLCTIHITNMYYSYQVATYGFSPFNYDQVRTLIMLNVFFYVILLLQFVFKNYNFSSKVSDLIKK